MIKCAQTSESAQAWSGLCAMSKPLNPRKLYTNSGRCTRSQWFIGEEGSDISGFFAPCNMLRNQLSFKPFNVPSKVDHPLCPTQCPFSSAKRSHPQLFMLRHGNLIFSQVEFAPWNVHFSQVKFSPIKYLLSPVKCPIFPREMNIFHLA